MFTTLMISVDRAHSEQMAKAVTVATDLAKHYDAKSHIVGVTMSDPTKVETGEPDFTEKLTNVATLCSDTHGAAVNPVVKLSHDLSIDLDSILMQAATDLEA